MQMDVKRTQMKKDTAITFRLAAPLKKALAREARQERRSLASYVEKILADRKKESSVEAGE
jgi:predicted HicB family RNase H-like nuclease